MGIENKPMIVDIGYVNQIGGPEGNKNYTGKNNFKQVQAPITDLVKTAQLNDDVVDERERKSRNLVQGVFRSIRAAIMSRNMSHNLGSHVLSYLKIQLSNVGNIKDNKLLSDLIDKNNSIKESVDWNNLELPFMVGLGHFISLLQERQDYIATIATDYIPCYTPVDFKEAIFDGLNPDYKWIRHKDDSEREKGRHPKNILLEYIARSEGLTRDESMGLGKLNFKYGCDIEDKEDSNGYKWESIDGDDPNKIDFMRGKQMALPGGMLGRQAIFSIIENIIRNAAKHEVRKIEQKDLNITLGIIDGDMVVNKATKGLSNKILSELECKVHLGDYWFLSISYPASEAEELKETLQKKLRGPFMDEDFLLVDEDKGMKEIIISAAFLRRQSNLSDNNVKAIVNLLTKTETNAQKDNVKIADNCKLIPSNGEPEFVYIDSDKDGGEIRYVIPIRKVLPLMVCTEGMSDYDKNLFNAKTDNCPWQVCDSYETMISDSVTRGFEYYIVSNKEVYNKVRPYGTNRIIIWEERDDEMKEYWHGEETQFHHLMRIVSALHAHCSIHPNNEEEFIYIDDGKASSYHPIGNNSKIEEEMWTSNYGGINEEERKELQRLFDFHPAAKGKKVKYFYRTHLETSTNFKGYIEKRIYESQDYFQNDFIEGISGGNSTDRLLRREPYTFTTYTNHFHAAQSRVAIIDERIFKDIHGIDGSLCVDNENNVTGNKAFRSLQFMQKGIEIFAIIPIKDGKTFALVGCVMLKNKRGKRIVGCKYCQLATLSFNENYELSINASIAFCKGYDYFAIHQGILDKLYEPFKKIVTPEGGKKTNKEYKLNVTKTLYNCFMDSETIPCPGGKEDFLPNFIIHSGRGKCSKADMPQKLPFVSYAQMSHAINDCKYNLIQLFDYVRYEGN